MDISRKAAAPAQDMEQQLGTHQQPVLPAFWSATLTVIFLRELSVSDRKAQERLRYQYDEKDPGNRRDVQPGRHGAYLQESPIVAETFGR